MVRENEEINEKVVELLSLPDEVLEIPHLNNSSLSEVNYRLAWARTLLKKYGAITNGARGVWSITSEYSDVAAVDGNAIEKARYKNGASPKDTMINDDLEDVPEEVRPWRKKLYEVLTKMNPYAFERLMQRV